MKAIFTKKLDLITLILEKNIEKTINK